MKCRIASRVSRASALHHAWSLSLVAVALFGCDRASSRGAPAPLPSSVSSAPSSAGPAASAAPPTTLPRVGSRETSAALPTTPGPRPVVVATAPPVVGTDDAPGARVKRDVAVVLYGVVSKEGLRFSPVLCVKGGALAHAVTCGELMPSAAPVRTTSGIAGVPRALTLNRAARDFKDEAGDKVFKAPRGPECCMYNACMGETLPYFATLKKLPPSGTVLAVWPADADVGLRSLARGGDPDAPVDPSWSSADAPARVDQIAVLGEQALAAVARPPCASCAAFYTRDHGAWRPLAGAAPGPDGYVALATTDVDHDGRLEAIVYERWRNDFGLFVLGNDWSLAPAYRFSCGNI